MTTAVMITMTIATTGRMSRMDLVGVEAGGLAKRINPYIF